jgi:hypothetical protein
MFDDTVVRVRAGTTTDRGGNTVTDWAHATRTEIRALSVQPTVQDENTGDERTTVVTGWHVLSEPGTAPDVRAEDRIEYQGMTCEVTGEVARWPDPLDGGVHHVEWTMRRVTG